MSSLLYKHCKTDARVVMEENSFDSSNKEQDNRSGVAAGV